MSGSLLAGGNTTEQQMRAKRKGANCLIAVLAGSAVVLTSCCCPQQMRCCGKERGTQSARETDFAAEDPGRTVERIRVAYPNPLPVTPRRQQGGSLCWANSAEMIMEFLGMHVPQCDQASVAFETQCCDNGTVYKPCDQASSPVFRHWGFALQEQFPPTGQEIAAHLSWSQVKAEIDYGQPFAFVLKGFDDEVAHMYVAIGYLDTAGSEALICLDPQAFALPKEVTVEFSQYSGSVTILPGNLIATPTPVQEHLHQADYFDIHWDPIAASNP